MPTDTSVKFLHSAMTGAPTLTGQAGSLIALLDACLVNGFGAGGVDSIVIADGVATATRSAGHPFEEDAVALIAGAVVTGGVINGEQKVTVATTTTYQFAAPGIPNQTAGGAITHKVAPLGWLKAFSGTNLAAFKASDPAATGGLLRVNDTGTTSARVVGYVSMTDVNTGIDAFPTELQLAGGLYASKSNSADATARPWILCGDGRWFYMPVARSGGAYELFLTFGDPINAKSPDPYGCALNGCFVSSLTNTASEFDYGDPGSTSGSLFFAKGYAGIGAAQSMRKAFPVLFGSSFGSSGASGRVSFPNLADGGFYVFPHYLTESGAGVLRATSPGLWATPQSVGSSVFVTRDRVKGVTGLAGKTLRAVNSASGVYFFDVTGPWR